MATKLTCHSLMTALHSIFFERGKVWGMLRRTCLCTESVNGALRSFASILLQREHAEIIDYVNEERPFRMKPSRPTWSNKNGQSVRGSASAQASVACVKHEGWGLLLYPRGEPLARSLGNGSHQFLKSGNGSHSAYEVQCSPKKSCTTKNCEE